MGPLPISTTTIVTAKDNVDIENPAAAAVNDNANDDSTTIPQESEDGHTYVDYIPPPEIKVLPPAKYKLWMIIFVLVYFARWVADASELMTAFRLNGWLDPQASLLAMLALIVGVLVYAASDVLVALCTVRCKNGSVYGLDAWLKQSRAQWVYCHENVLLELLARMVYILENGFAMFDAPPTTAQRRERPVHFDCDDAGCQTTLKIEHRIKPDKFFEYRKWTERINTAVHEHPGFLSCEKTKLPTERDNNNNNNNNSMEEMEEGTRTLSDDQTLSGDQKRMDADVGYQAIYVKFASIDALNGWMISPRRKALMKSLDPLLIQPDVVQIAVKTQQERQLPGAFSDLLIRQGDAVPTKPPKKWKVWWLTTVALFTTIKFTETFLPYYMDQWGLTGQDERLVRLVDVLVDTFVNSYIVTPLFLFVFHHWLQPTSTEVQNTRQPWNTFDEGIQGIWWKLVITVAFYGGCTAAILVKQYQEGLDH